MSSASWTWPTCAASRSKGVREVDAIIWVVFALLVWTAWNMPTKAEIRRLLSGVGEEGRPHGWRSAIEGRVGAPCTLTLTEPLYACGTSGELAGTVIDVDDEWVLLEVSDKKGTRQVAVRLDMIKGIEE